jgi:hypothetical protein
MIERAGNSRPFFLRKDRRTMKHEQPSFRTRLSNCLGWSALTLSVLPLTILFLGLCLQEKTPSALLTPNAGLLVHYLIPGGAIALGALSLTFKFNKPAGNGIILGVSWVYLIEFLKTVVM